MSQNNWRALKIVLFIFFVVITDKGLGLLLRKLYFNQSTGQNSSLNYVFSECNSDVLVFGNSRAQHHYDSRIISAALKMSCFNAGQDGGHSILLPYAQIKVITERFSPKKIILEFSTDDIDYNSRHYELLSILLPYYEEYPELRPFILLRGPFENIKLMSSIYPFNSNIINIIRFNTNTEAARKKDIDGFVPIDGVMSNDMLKPKPNAGIYSKMVIQSIVDTNKVNALENIIRICKEKNIALYIINSPVFHTVTENRSLQSPISNLSLEIIHRNNVNYFDCSFDSTFLGHFEWFSDPGHLNKEGARVFSSMIVDKILQDE